MMRRALGARSIVSIVLVMVVSATLAGCASTAPAPSPTPRAARAAVDGIRRVVVVAGTESKFAVDAGAGKEPGPEFDQIMKWLPYQDLLVPIARAVYWGITWLIDDARTSDVLPKDVTPAAVVTEAFARTVLDSGPFDHIVVVDREPTGDTRRNAEAIVRIAVPSWGLVRVRDGEPQLVAAVADVRAQIVTRQTGVVVWEHAEDVTGPERLPLSTLTGDRAAAREELVDVLTRAGRRLASELAYARSGGR